MKIVKIPKKNGKFRTIYKPNTSEKVRLKSHVEYLTKLAYHCCPPCVHGFMPGRSPVTNAYPHIGYKYTLCFDLSDWFDTVTPWHVERMLSDYIINVVFFDGAPRQGLPTSPAVANLAAANMDVWLLTAFSGDIVYTRYADDLSVSFNNQKQKYMISDLVWSVVDTSRFTLNPDKTRLQRSSIGRRVITGVAVDDKYCYPTRAVRRKLRAARHQRNDPSSRGLAEWCRLQPPRAATQKASIHMPKRGKINRAIDLFES